MVLIVITLIISAGSLYFTSTLTGTLDSVRQSNEAMKTSLDEVVAAIRGEIPSPLVPQEFRWLSTETDPESIEVIRSIINDFQTEYPYYRVHLQTVSSEEVDTILAAGLAAGNPPALAEASPDDVLERLAYLEPLDDIVERIGVEEFWSGFRDFGKIEGHYYMMPLFMADYCWMYRADWFEEKGLAVPTTYAELLTVAEALTEDLDGDGTIDRYGIVWPYSTSTITERVFDMNRYQYTGYDAWDADLKLILDEEPVYSATVDYINYIKEIVKYSPPGSVEYSYADTRTAYWTELAAIHWYGGRTLIEISRENPALEEPVTKIMNPQPTGPAGTWGYFYDMDGLMVFKDATGVEAAKEFAHYLIAGMNGEIITRLCASVPTHLIPPIKSMATSPAYMNLPGTQTWSDAYADYLDMLDNQIGGSPELMAGMQVVDGQMVWSGTVNPIAGHVIGKQIWQEMLQKVIVGGETAEAALDWAIAEIEATMIELGYEP
jgi:multiple sugar transport system substrate-binding protein